MLADSLGVSVATLLFSPYQPGLNASITPVWKLPIYRAWAALTRRRSAKADELVQPAEDVRFYAEELNSARVIAWQVPGPSLVHDMIGVQSHANLAAG